jgi:hypothetical protein
MGMLIMHCIMKRVFDFRGFYRAIEPSAGHRGGLLRRSLCELLAMTGQLTECVFEEVAASLTTFVPRNDGGLIGDNSTRRAKKDDGLCKFERRVYL